VSQPQQTLPSSIFPNDEELLKMAHSQYIPSDIPPYNNITDINTNSVGSTTADPTIASKKVQDNDYEVIYVLDRVCDLLNHRSCYQTAFSLGIVNIWVVLNELPAKNRNINLSQFFGTDLYHNVRYFDTSQDCIDALRGEGYDIWVSTLSPVAKELNLDNLQAATFLSNSFFEQFELTSPTSLSSSSSPALDYDIFRSRVNEMITPVVPKKLAIVVGRETDGASTAMISQATTQVYIPMSGFAESFNVSVAGALLLGRIVSLIEFQKQVEKKCLNLGLSAPFTHPLQTPRPQKSLLLTRSQQFLRWKATRECIEGQFKNYLIGKKFENNPINSEMSFISLSIDALYNGACASFKNDPHRSQLLKTIGISEATLQPLHVSLLKNQIELDTALNGSTPTIPGMNVVIIQSNQNVTENSEDGEEELKLDDEVQKCDAQKNKNSTKPKVQISKSKDLQGDQCCFFQHLIDAPSPDNNRPGDVDIGKYIDTVFAQFNNIVKLFSNTKPENSPQSSSPAVPTRRTASQIDELYANSQQFLSRVNGEQQRDSCQFVEGISEEKLNSFLDASFTPETKPTRDLLYPSPVNIIMRWLILNELREIILTSNKNDCSELKTSLTSTTPLSTPSTKSILDSTQHSTIVESLSYKSHFKTQQSNIPKFIAIFQHSQFVLQLVDHLNAPTQHNTDSPSGEIDLTGVPTQKSPNLTLSSTVDFSQHLSNIKFGELYFLSTILSASAAVSIKFFRGTGASVAFFADTLAPFKTFLGKIQMLLLQFIDPNEHDSLQKLVKMNKDYDEYVALMGSKPNTDGEQMGGNDGDIVKPIGLTENEKVILRTKFTKNIATLFNDRLPLDDMVSQFQTILQTISNPVNIRDNFLSQLNSIVDEFKPTLLPLLNKYGNIDSFNSHLFKLSHFPPLLPQSSPSISPPNSVWDDYNPFLSTPYCGAQSRDITHRIIDMINVPISATALNQFSQNTATLREFAFVGNFSALPPKLASFILNLLDGAISYKYLPHYISPPNHIDGKIGKNISELPLSCHNHIENNDRPCYSCMALTTPICNTCSRLFLGELLPFIFNFESQNETNISHINPISTHLDCAIRYAIETVLINNNSDSKNTTQVDQSQSNSDENSIEYSILGSTPLTSNQNSKKFIQNNHLDIISKIKKRLIIRFLQINLSPSQTQQSNSKHDFSDMFQLFHLFTSTSTSPYTPSRFNPPSPSHLFPDNYPNRLVDLQRYPIVQAQSNPVHYSVTFSMSKALLQWVHYFTNQVSIPKLCRSQTQTPTLMMDQVESCEKNQHNTTLYGSLLQNPIYFADRLSQLSSFSFPHLSSQLLDDLLHTGNCTTLYTKPLSFKKPSKGDDNPKNDAPSQQNEAIELNLTIEEFFSTIRTAIFVPVSGKNNTTNSMNDSEGERKYVLHPLLTAMFFVDVSFVIFVKNLANILHILITPITNKLPPIPSNILSTLTLPASLRSEPTGLSKLITELAIEAFIRSHFVNPIDHSKFHPIPSSIDGFYNFNEYMINSQEDCIISSEFITNDGIEIDQFKVLLLGEMDQNGSNRQHYSPFTIYSVFHASRIDNTTHLKYYQNMLYQVNLNTGVITTPPCHGINVDFRGDNRGNMNNTNITAGNPFLISDNNSYYLFPPPSGQVSIMSKSGKHVIIPATTGKLVQLG
jgi:tRNA(Leu) C34 or U34 (ribose-2'-O)-methylase TrmL